MAAYEVLLLNTAIPQIQAAQAGDTYVCPRDIQITANLNVTGNTTLGDASTDTVQVNGYMGVGGAPASSIATYIRNSALTGATQHGIVSSPVGSTAGTSEVSSVSGQPGTSASAYTVANVYSFWAFDALKGAGSTITNLHGLYVRDLTQGTNNYGITSIVSSGTNKWNIYASGTAANYFAGNVGIGTSSTTSSRLTISGGSQITSDNGNAYNLQFATNVTGRRSGEAVAQVGTFNNNSAIEIGAGNSGAAIYLGGNNVAGGSEVRLWTANTERMRIDSSGNVGIGTSSPLSLLHVAGDIRSTGDIVLIGGAGTPEVQFFQNSGNWKIAVDNDAMQFVDSSAATERLRIDSSGNVGIGTSSPATKLVVSGNNTGAANNTLRFVDTATNTATDQQIGKIEFFSSDTSTPGAGVKAYIGAFATDLSPEAYLAFATDTTTGTPTERMRIDASGNVGIGTNAPVTFGKLAVVGSVDVNNTIAFRTNDPTVNNTSFNSIVDITGTAKDSGGVVRYNNTTIEALGSTSNGGTLVFRTDDSSAVLQERMRIDSSGNVGIGTSSPNASAILDAQSTTKGVRMPNMTTTQKNAIASPAAGLIVFDTTLAKLCVYSGAAWETITSV